MIEISEALSLANQLNSVIIGKTVAQVCPPTKEHKFCWFNGEPAEYDGELQGKSVVSSEGFGIFVEIAFAENRFICVNDGVNMRYYDNIKDAPKNYQLLICFTDGTALAFTVAMYGGIVLHFGDYDNEYYIKSRTAISPFSNGFKEYYYKTLNQSGNNLSAKAFLATEQRFAGIGNGSSQDILFVAGINPKRKISTLSEEEKEKLFLSVVSVLNQMKDCGGRNTEKDIFGNVGGYQTKMSKNTVIMGCPNCGDTIIKETYLGGSVYYCPICQPLK